MQSRTNSRTFCVSSAPRTSPAKIWRPLHRSSIGSVWRRSVKRWAAHWPASISMCRRSTSTESGTIASYGVRRPLPGRQARCGSSGACLGRATAMGVRCVPWTCVRGSLRALGRHGPPSRRPGEGPICPRQRVRNALHCWGIGRRPTAPESACPNSSGSTGRRNVHTLKRGCAKRTLSPPRR